jgi:tetratricopeptide (TPR) repeat protein
MNRTTVLKLTYILMLLILSLTAFFMIFFIIPRTYLIITLLSAGIILLIPGRISQFYYQKFYKGRVLCDKGEYNSSIQYFNDFLQDISKAKWKKVVLWFTWSIYTVDIEAMTNYNIGSVYLNIGDLKKCEIYSNTALQYDNKYPLPYINLAMIELLTGNKEKALYFIDQMKKLGYKHTSIDKLIFETQSLYAKLQSLNFNK